VQSVPITTKVVSSNPVHGEVYPRTLNVIKLGGSSVVFSGFLHNKTDRYDINEILLIKALDTITLKPLA